MPRGPKEALADAVWDQVASRFPAPDPEAVSQIRRDEVPDPATLRRSQSRKSEESGWHGRLFTSESVTEGHPDKMADQISDAVLDAMLKGDPRSRVAVETLITTGQVHVAGEVTTETYVDIPGIIREKILDIGYDSSAKGYRRGVVRRVRFDRLPVTGHRAGGAGRVRAPRGRGIGRARPAGRRRPGTHVRLRLRGDAPS